ncbi:hypothetical protein [Modestobacter sp. NPDC049651]|uniref:hypothetical protein n=1 Tax=unclassified Modestobacter TaxID=2643866 RepID=UPI0033CBE06C
MSGSGAGTGADGERRVEQRPAVPPLRRDGGDLPDGVHRTEAVPFPLPPLPAAAPEEAPEPAPDETGRLQLRQYPPVPPPARRPARPESGDTPEESA